MKSPKTENSSIGDLFGLKRKEQPAEVSNNMSWGLIGIIVGSNAILLFLFYLMIKKNFETHTERLMVAPVAPAAEKPKQYVPVATPEIQNEKPVVLQQVQETAKKESKLL